MRKFILPKRITWPGGFVIRVEEVLFTTESMATFDYDNSGNAIISLKKGMTQAQQRYYLSHELIHAAVDYHHLMIEEGAST